MSLRILNDGSLAFEGERIVYRNFAGVESEFNRKGDRNFCIVIPTKEDAIAMFEAGWNVQLRPQGPQSKELREAIKGGHNFMEKLAILNNLSNDPDDAIYLLKVNVKFESRRPAEIYLVTDPAKKPLKMDEDTCAKLDLADIIACDIVVAPHSWATARGSGISAYLKTIYVMIRQDPFAAKYALDDEDRYNLV